MKYIKKTLPLLSLPLLPIDVSLETMLYIDIETTGLSGEESYIYLIGTLSLINGVPTIQQWFLETISEEKELLKEFISFCSSFSCLVHYNGSNFDLPFLQKRCNFHDLNYSFSSILSYDIYKEIRPFRSYFKLPDLKQQTIEKFFNWNRKGIKKGVELITIYTQYIGRRQYEQLHKIGSQKNLFAPLIVSKSSGLPTLPLHSAKELQNILLLHNEEDLIGLIICTAFLNYLQLFQGKFKIVSGKIKERQNTVCFLLSFEQKVKKHLSFSFKFPLPTPDDWQQKQGTVFLKENFAFVSLPFYSGILKYFFPNYKEYYYLPIEDMAIHKSVAKFVDKAYKIKAAKETACQKKEGIFLPQKEVIFTPIFQKTPKDKISYFELTKELFINLINVEEYSIKFQKYLKNILPHKDK